MEAEPEYRYLSTTYTCARLLEEVPARYPFRSNIFRSTFYLNGFPFCRQIDLYCVAEPGKRALAIDTGHPDLCGRAALDGISKTLHVPWEDTEVFLSHFHDDHDGNMVYCMQKGTRAAYSGPAPEDPPAELQTFLRSSAASDLMSDEVRSYFNLVGSGKAMVRQTAGWRSELQGGEVLPIAGYRLEAIPTPGHTANHMCLLDREKGILFAGDHICDAPPGFMQFGINEHLLSRYLENLAELRAMNLSAIYMCHHDPLNGSEQINAFIEVLESRNQTLAEKTRVLFAPEDRLTVRDAAYRIAAHYPKGLDGFPNSIQAQRIATAFASLEYLYDTGFCDRAFDDDGALVYWRRGSGETCGSIAADLKRRGVVSHVVFRKGGKTVSVPTSKRELPLGTYRNISKTAGWR